MPDPGGAGTIRAAFEAAGSGRAVAVRACGAAAVAAALDSGACDGASIAADAASAPAWAVSASAWAALGSGAALAAAVSGAVLPSVSGAAGATAVALPALGAVFARARDVAGFALGLAAAFPGRAGVVLSDRAGVVLPDRAGVVFDRVLAACLDREDAAVVFDREDAAVVFDREPGPDAADRVLAAGKPDGAWPVPPAAGGRASDPVASALAWSWPAEAALADRGRLAARGWLSVPAGCLLAARLGAGPVPCPGELSPGIPFSEVTAP